MPNLQLPYKKINNNNNKVDFEVGVLRGSQWCPLGLSF